MVAAKAEVFVAVTSLVTATVEYSETNVDSDPAVEDRAVSEIVGVVGYVCLDPGHVHDFDRAGPGGHRSIFWAMGTG